MRITLKNLHWRTAKTLAFIVGWCQANAGNFPTVRDIQAGVGFASTNTVIYHLRALGRSGLLERRNGRWCVVGARWIAPEEEKVGT